LSTDLKTDCEMTISLDIHAINLKSYWKVFWWNMQCSYLGINFIYKSRSLRAFRMFCDRRCHLNSVSGTTTRALKIGTQYR